jgi:hypothetical protein
LDSKQFVMQGNECLPVAPLQILISSTGGGTDPGLRFSNPRAEIGLRQACLLQFQDQFFPVHLLIITFVLIYVNTNVIELSNTIVI